VHCCGFIVVKVSPPNFSFALYEIPEFFDGFV
jgi:hypothetical protein